MTESQPAAFQRPTRWGGVTSLVGVAAFIVTVIALHVLQPEYDLVNHLMSELALGPHGWAMFAAFAGLAIAVFGIQLAAGLAGAPRGFRMLLVVASFFFLAAGIFPLGSTSEIHIAAIASAFMLSVLAMYLFPGSAAVRLAQRPVSFRGRWQPPWRSASRLGTRYCQWELAGGSRSPFS